MGTSRAKRATDEVLNSCDRVAKAAKAVTESLDNRDKRALTDPFIRVVEETVKND